MNKSKKIVLAGAAIAVGTLAVFAGIPGLASAQTATTASDAQIAAEIQALNAAIAQLEVQYGFTVPVAVYPSGVVPGSTVTGVSAGTGIGTASTPGAPAVLGASTSNVLLNITANPAMNSATITPGSANQHIASFLVTNETQQPISLSDVNGIEINPGTSANIYLDMRVYVNGALYGTQSGITSDTSYPIAGTAPVTIAPGAQATIDVYADISATAPLGIANTASLYLSVPNAVSSSVVYGQTMTTGAVAATSGSSSGVTISSISPSNGGTGTSILITGSGFGTSTAVFMNGMLAAQGIAPQSNSTFRFIVPISLRSGCTTTASAAIICSGTATLEGPGSYQITVESNGQVSNAEAFELTSNPYYTPQ